MVQTSFILAYLVIVSSPVVLSFLLRPEIGNQHTARIIIDAIILSAFPILAFQPVLAARIKMIDHIFGLDIVYVFHKTMAMVAGTLMISVPFLLILGNRDEPIFTEWENITANIAFLILIVMIVTALLHRELRLNYEIWRTLHNVMAVSLLGLVFISSLYAAANIEVKILNVILIIIASLFYIYHKVVGPWWRLRNAFVVTSVIQVSHNVWNLKLGTPSGDSSFDYLPGQFHFLTFDRGRGLPKEEHPFTISSSPARKGLHTSTIKESGDFTGTIGKTRPGDKVAVQGPFGRFSYVLHPEEKKMVFIAGGIGITPFMSMLRHMKDTKADKEVLLLYANSKERDILFRDELDSISAGTRPGLKTIHIISRPEGEWKGEKGHIDRNVIKRYTGSDQKDRSYYICGPPSMMNDMIPVVMELGVPSSRVRSERFAL